MNSDPSGKNARGDHVLLRRPGLSARRNDARKPKAHQKIREQIIPMATGTVLEVGVGPGVSFPYYDPAKVSKVYALEPNPGMVVRAENQRRQTELDVEFLGLPGE